MCLLNISKMDEIILSCLSKDAKISTKEIVIEFKRNGITRTERAVLGRIHRLEQEGIISGYTLKTKPQNYEGKIIRFVLISFKTSELFEERVAMFTNYLHDAPFAALAARTRGEYDWINVKIFPNTKVANMESDSFRTLFGDIIDKYMAFDLTPIKGPDFVRAVNYTIREFYEFVEKCIGVTAVKEEISLKDVPQGNKYVSKSNLETN